MLQCTWSVCPHVEVHNLELQHVLEYAHDQNSIQDGSTWINIKAQGEALDGDWHISSIMDGLDHVLGMLLIQALYKPLHLSFLGFGFPMSETLLLFFISERL